MGIKFNALSAGGSLPTQPSFPARSADSASGAAPDDQNPNADSGATPGGTAGQAAAADGGASGSGDGTAGGAITGPSAQTRHGQASPAQGSTRPRSRAAAAASAQPAVPPQDATDDAVATNFGSVMATALGRGAAGSADASTMTRSASDSSDAVSPSGTTQPATTPTDAVAWIAQVMMTTGAAQPATGSPASSAAEATTGARVGAATAQSATRTGLSAALGAAADETDDAPTAATIASGNTTAAGQSPTDSTAANRLQLNAVALPQDAGQATVQTSDAQVAANAGANSPGAANFNALADVQKFISGMTHDDTAGDADTGAAAATPGSHATTGGDSVDGTQAAAALQASSLTRTGAGLGTTTLTIHAPVGSAAFADEVSGRVTSLAQSGITEAQLQLNPAGLGPVQVHITMQSGQASVWFGATHSDTRAALEQSLPRLREMFASAGLPLSDSGVFREPPQQQSQAQASSGNSRTSDSATAATASVTQVANVRLSLLDTYA